MNRRGDWIQVFLILFFVFLLILTFFLFAIQTKAHPPIDPAFKEDARHASTHLALMSVLRTPWGEGMLADTIAQGITKDELSSVLATAIPADAYYEMWITYPDKELYVARVPPGAESANGLNIMPSAIALLPGGVEIRFKYAYGEDARESEELVKVVQQTQRGTT